MRKFVSGLIVGLVGVGVCAAVCFAVVNIGFKGANLVMLGIAILFMRTWLV